MTTGLPTHAGLTTEASYRYDERLAILGCYGEPTPEQHKIAWDEAIAFDVETKLIAMESTAPDESTS